MATVIGTTGNDFIHVSGDGHMPPAGYNDIPLATDGHDTINPDAGTNIVFAGGGDDRIRLTHGFTTGSRFDGGSGFDTIVLSNVQNGGALNIANIEKISLVGHQSGSAFIGTSDSAGATGQTLIVDISQLVAPNVVFDGQDETDGEFHFIGSQGSDRMFLTGGQQGDTFDLASSQSAVRLQGLAGDDLFERGAFLGSADTIDGGAGNDTLTLSGSYSAGLNLGTSFGPPGTINATGPTLVNIESIQLGDGFSYNFTTDNSVVTKGQTLTVNASRLHASSSMTWNGAAETDGTFVLLGGAGDDVLAGAVKGNTISSGAGDDRIDASTSRNNTIDAGAGNDTILLGAGFTAASQVNGGNGRDTAVLNGNYAAGLTLAADMLTNVEILTLDPSHSYDITTSDATVATNAALTIDGSVLGAGDRLLFDGSAETDGSFIFYGGAAADRFAGSAGDDVASGGLGSDRFDLSQGGVDTALGGDGDDSFDLGASFSGASRIDGGEGVDTLRLAGSYAADIVLKGLNAANLETLVLGAGFDYALQIRDGTVAADRFLTIDGSALGAGNSLVVHGDFETDGRLILNGGAGDDRLFGSAYANRFTGGLGADNLIAAAGHDTFVDAGVADSTGGAHDKIKSFSGASDKIDLPSAVSGVDAAVNTGQLSTATFNADLETAIGGAQLGVSHAVLFRPDTGDLAGERFLIVDANGQAGYQADQDFVIQMNGFSGPLTTANFI